MVRYTICAEGPDGRRTAPEISPKTFRLTGSAWTAAVRDIKQRARQRRARNIRAFVVTVGTTTGRYFVNQGVLDRDAAMRMLRGQDVSTQTAAAASI